jgi:hypothetical protein
MKRGFIMDIQYELIDVLALFVLGAWQYLPKLIA